MDQGLRFHVLLALISSLWAVRVWQQRGEPQLLKTEIQILSLAAEELKSVTWHSDSEWAQLRFNDKLEVLQHTFNDREPPVIDTQRLEAYPGLLPRAREVWRGLAPLVALRALKQVDSNQLEQQGLTASSAHLIYESKQGKIISFDVGHAIFGTGDYPILREDGRVFLISGNKLNPLSRGAGSLEDHQAVVLADKQIKSIKISQGVKTVVLTAESDDGRQLLEKAGQIRAIHLNQTPPPTANLIELVFIGKNDEAITLSFWALTNNTALATGFAASQRFAAPFTTPRYTLEPLQQLVERIIKKS